MPRFRPTRRACLVIRRPRSGATRRADFSSSRIMSAGRAGKGASTNAKTSKTAKAVKKAANAAVPREFSKTAIVLGMLKTKGGATTAEIQKVTNWQAHSVRGLDADSRLAGGVRRSWAVDGAQPLTAARRREPQPLDGD